MIIDHKKNTYRKKPEIGPAFYFFLLLILLGSTIEFIFFDDDLAIPATDSQKKLIKRSNKNSISPVAMDPVGFTFYLVLENKEFFLSNNEVEIRAKETKKSVTDTYTLQVGSFRSEEVAVSLKDKLIKMGGFDVKIQKKTVESIVWFRVILGPSKNIHAINRVKKRLYSYGFESIVLMNKS